MKSKTYEEFVEKFKPKLTTDDCATPPLVYDTVLKWVCQEYGVDPENVVRPFWPGQDYTAEEYPAGCVVVDNPPFSILTQICAWYLARGIKFFLFAPTLTALGGKDICMQMEHLICDADVVYENGAHVATSFVTNLGDGETVLRTVPELSQAINDAVRVLLADTIRKVTRYRYPKNVVTSALAQRYARYGIHFTVKRSECVRIAALDAQRPQKRAIFGAGLLLSEAAAQRHAEADRAATGQAELERQVATEWQLSDREKALVRSLG